MHILQSIRKCLLTYNYWWLYINDYQVKGMKSPPAGVKLVLEAVCIVKNVKPIRMKDPNSGKMVDDYWEASKKMLMEQDFLESLRTYDKDNIPDQVKFNFILLIYY